MKKHITILLALTACTVVRVTAQDPHFSSYYYAPMIVNPASVGKDVDDWRLMSVYRAQWWGSGSASFNTYTVSMEKRIVAGNTGKSQLGMGAYFMGDVSNSGILKNNYVSVGAAYNMALDAEGKKMIGIGLQGLYANRMVDNNKTEFQSQFGSMGFQRSIPSDDPVNVSKRRYWDVNIGVLYSQQENNWGYYLGGALFHAAKPQDGTTNAVGGVNSIPSRVTVQGGMHFDFSGNSGLALSSVADFQAGNRVVALGAVGKMGINDPTIRSFNFGLWNRFGDALTPVVGFQFTDMLFTLAYDITTSSIKTVYNDVQSFELGFAWQLGAGRTGAVKRSPVIIY